MRDLKKIILYGIVLVFIAAVLLYVPPIILVLLVCHWYLSLGIQSIFMHRYSAHGQIQMSSRVEKAFWILAFILLGPSYLSAYISGLLHRLHHAYSDSPADPHPADMFHGPWGLFQLMWRTKVYYSDIGSGKYKVDEKFKENVPEWESFDKFASSWWCRMAWVGIYIFVYISIDPPLWCYPLLLIHFIMGPLHGVVINWFAHKYGDAPHETGDSSKNVFDHDILMGGEAYHNDHHKYPSSPNFGIEGQYDMYYHWMLFLERLGFIKIKKTT